jgi:monothiol glutaredoxin
MSVIAYLKQQCGWSRGVREVLAKYGIEYEERQIHIPENFQEMVEKTGQAQQPCVQLADNLILSDISGDELQNYLVENGEEYVVDDGSVPLDSSCTPEEEALKQQALGQNNGGSQPHIPVRDTGFYESH